MMRKINELLSERYVKQIIGNKSCFRYHDLFFFITHIGGLHAYVIEYANAEDAMVGRFEDGDLFDEKMPIDKMIESMIAEIEN